MPFFKDLVLKYKLRKNHAFIWDSKSKKLNYINKIETIKLDLIIGIDRQKKLLTNNTINFSLGNFSNNALLWGVRGNGKSTLIKSVFKKISKKNKSIKLIQINKSDIFDIEIFQIQIYIIY